MTVSESGEIINRLIASGVNMESIGQAIGRNRSLVRQVGLGRKPGNNLRDSLARLELRVSGVAPEVRNTAARVAPVPAAPRRQTTAGTTARVRRATTVQGRSFATSQVKQQAARGGARGLGRPLGQAAQQGRTVAVTAGFGKRVSVNNTSGGRRGKTGRGGVVEMNLGDAAQVQAAVDAQHGGNLAAYVAAQAIERGYLSGVSDERDAQAAMVSLELRSF